MNSIENTNSNAQFGITLEESASSLTQGVPGGHFEAALGKRPC